MLPAEPAIDIQAAMNIAGRLGFETTALTLPLVLKAPDVSQPAAIAVPIVVGRSTVIARLVERGVIDLKPLNPARTTAGGAAAGGPDGIAIAGDDEGT